MLLRHSAPEAALRVFHVKRGACQVAEEWEIYGVQSASREDRQELPRFLDRSGVRPVIWKTWPLEAAPEAHRQLGERRAIGRMVLVP